MDKSDYYEVIKSEAIPSDLVTMNSRVRLKDLSNNQEVEWTLVSPGKADIRTNKISVLAPAAMALIGLGIGDKVSLPSLEGGRKFRIEKILYQPETAGAA